MCSVILEALRKSGEIKWVGKMSHLKVEVTKSNQSIIKVLFIIWEEIQQRPQPHFLNFESPRQRLFPRKAWLLLFQFNPCDTF